MSKSKSNPTTLSNLLNIAASNAATREAAAKKAAAEQAEAEQAEAEAATDKTFSIIADVTGATKDAGGFPAVTALMGRLADYAVSGVATPAPPVPPSSGTAPDPALVAERDGLRNQVAELITERDSANTAKDSAEAELASANTANSNLQTQLDAAVAAKDSAETAKTAAETELANERNPRHANSLAKRLTESQAGRDAAEARIRELPELDLTKTTFRGDTVKVPLETAEKINSVRSDLRALFRLDPAPAPAA